jgi:hypothetical protein
LALCQAPNIIVEAEVRRTNHQNERGRQPRRPYFGGRRSPVNQPTASDFIGSFAMAICST